MSYEGDEIFGIFYFYIFYDVKFSAWYFERYFGAYANRVSKLKPDIRAVFTGESLR